MIQCQELLPGTAYGRELREVTWGLLSVFLEVVKNVERNGEGT